MQSKHGYADHGMETMPLEKLKDLQLTKLKKMVRFAYENNAIYRKAFETHGVSPDMIRNLSDLARFPILTKEDLVRHFPYGFLTVPENQIAKVFLSGGTTGKPITMYYTREDYAELVKFASRLFPAAGLVPPEDGKTGDRILHLLPQGSHIIDCFIDGARSIGLMVIPAHFGYNEPARHLEVIRDFGITALNIAPTGAKGSNLAGLLEVDEEGIIEKYIKTIIYAGAPMPPEMRKDLLSMGKNVLGAYGSTEIGGIGYQSINCGEIEPGSFHVFGDLTLIEIVDDDGLPLEPGQRGYLLVTTLGWDNFAGCAVPIIRYRIGDMCTLIEGVECACGRTPQYIVKPQRVEDLPRMEKGCAGEF